MEDNHEDIKNNDKLKTEPYLLETSKESKKPFNVSLKKTQNPLSNGTLCDIGIAIEVLGQDHFSSFLILIQPYTSETIRGIDESSIRFFIWNDKSNSLQPVWNSGINTRLRFIWAKIQRSGIYVPIGLPHDRLLQEVIREIAYQRRYTDTISEKEVHTITKQALKLFEDLSPKELDELRALITRLELNTSLKQSFPEEVDLGHGLHFLTFPFPQGKSLEDFKQLIQKLNTPIDGLPEEYLFYPPEIIRNGEPPWPLRLEQQPWNGINWSKMLSLPILKNTNISSLLPWLFSHNWYMYQHDALHTGYATGLSDIKSTNVNNLILQSEVPVDGPVNTKPSIVNGKIYVGTTRYQGGTGGTLYKIDISTGSIEGKFPTSGTAYYPIQGIGGSPAIINNKVYFTAVHGKVFCINGSTMTSYSPYPDPIWVTDLKYADPVHNQPVNNPNADCWSGPLVINGKVYVGCGEGEDPDTYGFVYCLDANSGNVIWFFCTSKFQNRRTSGSENMPNIIPASVAISDPLPQWAIDAGYQIQSDPSSTRKTGCSIWSSCAYDRILNRIYVGTGNSYSDSGVPDDWYGSGVLSLDANTGEFKAFFQPTQDDSYWPADMDVDIPSSPTILWRDTNDRVVAIGSKNGGFFLLDPDSLAPIAKRQLLPKAGGSGLPGDRGTPISSVVPTGGEGENSWGVFGTSAVHYRSGRLFVGLGGYSGIADQDKTPFLRALDWNTLQDAWPTIVGRDNVSRYANTTPPMYTSNEAGLSSPAVVNDVVFISTHKTALYALDVDTGLCLWSAPGLPDGGWPIYALGPAIYGNYVIIGAGNSIYIYRLSGSPIYWKPPEVIVPWWERIGPWPDPGPIHSQWSFRD